MFKDKFPAFYALIVLVAAGAKDATAPNETLVQKLENSISLIPQLLAFIPQVSNLDDEAKLLKSSPSDIEAGAELLVTELAFTSDKAKAIINAAFPLAQNLIGLIPQVKALAAAIG